MRIALLLLALAVAGCASSPPPATTPQPLPATAPSASMQWYQDAAAAGKTVWAIDSKASLIAVTVRRGGAMARLGHDHVVASRAIDGMVAPDDGRAHLRFRLDQLQVDDSDLRQQAGLTSAPSASAIEGTRTNMLTRVLDAERHPMVELSVAVATGSAAGPDGSSTMLRLGVRLNGAERFFDVPAQIDRRAGGLVATGSFTLRQTDFGITPMSVLGGAITVMDQLELRFSLVAGRP